MWQNAMQPSLILKVVSLPFPEVPAMDMWGFGCIMAELVTVEAVPARDTAGGRLMSCASCGLCCGEASSAVLRGSFGGWA
jgi:hypothetical protein